MRCIGAACEWVSAIRDVLLRHGLEFGGAGGEEGGGVREDVGVLVLVGGEQEAEGEAAGVGVGVCVGDGLGICGQFWFYRCW